MPRPLEEDPLIPARHVVATAAVMSGLPPMPVTAGIRPANAAVDATTLPNF